MPPPLSPVGDQAPRAQPSRRNVAVLSHAEYIPTLAAAAALRVKTASSRLKRPGDLDFLTLDVVWVTCDVGYLCAYFSLPSLSILELGRMYATDRRQTKASLNAPTY